MKKQLLIELWLSSALTDAGGSGDRPRLTPPLNQEGHFVIRERTDALPPETGPEA